MNQRMRYQLPFYCITLAVMMTVTGLVVPVAALDDAAATDAAIASDTDSADGMVTAASPAGTTATDESSIEPVDEPTLLVSPTLLPEPSSLPDANDQVMTERVTTDQGEADQGEAGQDLPRALTEDTRDAQIGTSAEQGIIDNVAIGPADARSRGAASYQPAALDAIPDTIDVAITAYANCSNWVNAGQPVIRVETMSFKEYVKNVLPNEWISSWHPEALKAGAIAAKNYGWRKKEVGARHYLQSMHGLDKAPDVVDNTCDQRYIAGTSKNSTDAAIDATWDFRLMRDNFLLINFYLATVNQCNVSPYQPCMPQWGSQDMARAGKNWQEIVQAYYAPVTIERISFLSEPYVPLTLYRFFNPQNRSHFFTSSKTERDQILNRYSQNEWRYEGAAYKTVARGGGNANPVYRFYSPRNRSHFYTAFASERDHIRRTYPESDWRYEGIAFYVLPSSYAGSANNVYRFWSAQNRSHFYTASRAERDHIIRTYTEQQWRYEGVAWKAPR